MTKGSMTMAAIHAHSVFKLLSEMQAAHSMCLLRQVMVRAWLSRVRSVAGWARRLGWKFRVVSLRANDFLTSGDQNQTSKI